jgi:hypothetical protein
MRAAGATNCARPPHLQHGRLNISDGYRPDHRSALVAQDIGFPSAHADDQATAGVNIGDVLCGMIGRPTLFTSMSKVGKREVVDRAPVSVAKLAAILYAAPLVRSASSTRCWYGHLRLQRRPLLPALSPMVRPIPAVDAVTRAVLFSTLNVNTRTRRYQLC